MIKRLLTVCALVVGLAAPATASAEWFYFGVQAGGQYLDLDALSAGQIFGQAVAEASTDLQAAASGGMADFEPEPTHYSAENAFAWGGFLGVNLGFFRIGGRFTHSFMDVVAEDPGVTQTDISFGLNLVTALIEARLHIPLWRFRPFFGIGIGYAFLDSETTIVHGGDEAYSELGTNCFDAMAELGLDFDIADWLAIGAAAHFSFIGFYYEDPADPTKTEAAWGFATDYLARLTIQI